MYLLDCHIPAGRGEVDAVVEGSTGTPYRVAFSRHRVTCECRDYLNRRLPCKHILFIVGRVCRQMPQARRLAESGLGRAGGYDELMEKVVEGLTTARDRQNAAAPLRRTLEEAESCPICFEEMRQVERLRQCSSECARWFHHECISVWLARSSRCPMCRGPFGHEFCAAR